MSLFPQNSDPLRTATKPPRGPSLSLVGTAPPSGGRPCWECDAATRKQCANCGGTGFELSGKTGGLPAKPAPHVPYQPSSDTSREGAQRAVCSADSQIARLETVYAAAGAMGLTDHEAVASYALHADVREGRASLITLSAMNARRAVMLESNGKDRVQKFGVRKNPKSGVNNNVYGLVRCRDFRHERGVALVHEQGEGE